MLMVNNKQLRMGRTTYRVLWLQCCRRPDCCTCPLAQWRCFRTGRHRHRWPAGCSGGGASKGHLVSGPQIFWKGNQIIRKLPSLDPSHSPWEGKDNARYQVPPKVQESLLDLNCSRGISSPFRRLLCSCPNLDFEQPTWDESLIPICPSRYFDCCLSWDSLLQTPCSSTISSRN